MYDVGVHLQGTVINFRAERLPETNESPRQYIEFLERRAAERSDNYGGALIFTDAITGISFEVAS